MKYQAVLFDFDYTLGDCTGGILQSVSFALAQMGKRERGEKEILRTVGLSIQDTYTALTKDREKAARESFAVFFKKKSDQVMAESAVFLPGAGQLLCWLKERGIRTGIVTNKFHYRIDQILGRLGAAQWIDVIIGEEDVKEKKPAPEGLIRAGEYLNIKPEQILYVGDSAVDAEMAMAAGADFAGVTTGAHGKEELEAYPHRMVGAGLMEVLQFLEESEGNKSGKIII